MPSTKVQKTSTTVKDDDGSEREQVQYQITIPRKLAEAYEFEDVHFEWSAKSADRFELSRA